MTPALANVALESGVGYLLEDGTRDFRGLPRRLMNFPDTDVFYWLQLTPLANGTHTIDELDTGLKLNTVAQTDADGDPILFETVYAVHLAVSAYNPGLPASGTVTAGFTSLFTTGGHSLEPGGACLFTCGPDGYAAGSSSELVLGVTSPVNMLIELLIIGKKPAA